MFKGAGNSSSNNPANSSMWGDNKIGGIMGFFGIINQSIMFKVGEYKFFKIYHC